MSDWHLMRHRKMIALALTLFIGCQPSFAASELSGYLSEGLKNLESKDESLRLQAGRSLDLFAPAIQAQILALARDIEHRDHNVRRASMEQLSPKMSEVMQEMQLLIPYLADSDADVRHRSFELLRDLSVAIREGMSAARLGLQDRDQDVRREAAKIFYDTRTGSSAVYAQLKNMTEKNDAQIKSHAAFLLNHLSRPIAATLSQLSRSLLDPNPDVRFYAGEAVETVSVLSFQLLTTLSLNLSLGDKKIQQKSFHRLSEIVPFVLYSLPALKWALRSEDGRVRERSVKVMEEIGLASRTVAECAKTFSEQHEGTNLDPSVRAFGEQAADAALFSLRMALADPHRETVNLANRALEKITRESSTRPA